MINGDERIIKEKSLWFLKLIINKKSKDIKFNWDPKLSDFKIDEIKRRISVLDKRTTSRFWLRLISFKPS